MIGLDKTKTNMNVKGMSRITSSLTCKNFREHYLTRFSRQLFVCLIWGAPSSMFTQGKFCSRWDFCKKKFKLFSFPVRCLKETLWKVATNEVEMSRTRDSTRDSSCKNFKKHTSTSLSHRLFVYVIRRALPSFFTQGHSCSRWNLRKTKKKFHPFPLRCIKGTSTIEITYLLQFHLQFFRGEFPRSLGRYYFKLNWKPSFE